MINSQRNNNECYWYNENSCCDSPEPTHDPGDCKVKKGCQVSKSNVTKNSNVIQESIGHLLLWFAVLTGSFYLVHFK